MVFQLKQEKPENISLTLNYSISNILSKELMGDRSSKNKGIILANHKLAISDKNLSKIDFNYLKNNLDAHIRLKRYWINLNF